MEHILKSWANTLRFLIILFILFLIINLIVNKFVNNTQFDINFTNDKTLVTLIDKKNVIANSVLPACDCWTNTGIEIRPGEEYEIKVSGKIHTIIDKLIRDAENDVMPKFRWLDPDGTAFIIREDKKFRESDSIRKTLLLSPTTNIGGVLFYFQKGNSLQPNCELKDNFYIPDSIIIYSSSKGLKGKNNESETWYVWASVNDILIRDFKSETDRRAYLGGVINDSIPSKLKKWAVLTNENYNRIWFDDNFGSFVISAKIIKPVSVFDIW